MRAQRAFTLIELLITASIFSIIILVIYAAFNTGILSSRRIEADLDIYQTARRVFNRIGLDLKNSFAYSPDDAKFTGENQGLAFFSLVASDFSFVSYELEDGKLLRICRKNLDSLDEEALVRPRILAYSVKELSFSYAYPAQSEDLYEWKGLWQEKDKLPPAVKIKLTLIEKLPKQKEKEIEFYRTVFLPLAG